MPKHDVTPKPIPQQVADRAFDRFRIDPDTGCWNSTRHTTANGYAVISYVDPETKKPKPYLNHRAAWVKTYGPIPDGMVIDHMCFNRICINPQHLRVLTRFENSQRQNGADFPLGQCGNGHSLEHMRTVSWGEKRREGRSQRTCWECLREKNARNSARLRAERLAEPTTSNLRQGVQP